ncbi:hypothetical protein [Nocardia sp. NPDC051570]|uniref:hypothetical protein n=1 Tax=Nocardia sp. NPDC051570 TaxID=3364324 RepID=UPI0037A5A048
MGEFDGLLGSGLVLSIATLAFTPAIATVLSFFPGGPILSMLAYPAAIIVSLGFLLGSGAL